MKVVHRWTCERSGVECVAVGEPAERGTGIGGYSGHCPCGCSEAMMAVYTQARGAVDVYTLAAWSQLQSVPA